MKYVYIVFSSYVTYSRHTDISVVGVYESKEKALNIIDTHEDEAGDFDYWYEVHVLE